VNNEVIFRGGLAAVFVLLTFIRVYRDSAIPEHKLYI